VVPNFELTERQFERTVRNKIACKSTWSKKMTLLSTFLKSSLNFLSRNLKKTLQKLEQSVRKVVSKFKLVETHSERTVRNKIASKTYLK